MGMPLIGRKAANNPLHVVFISDSSSATGAGLTGVTNASSGLTIEERRELEATLTSYTGANIQSITTLGTYAAPSASSIRLKEIGDGFYELQFLQARFGTGDASRFIFGLLKGVTNMAPCPFVIPLTAIDMEDAVRLALTALPNAAAGANGGLPLGDANARVDVGRWLGTAPAALSASGYVQAMVLRWLTDNAGGTPSALSSGNLPADVKLWLASAPDALSTGKLPADVKLWLAAAPNALISGRVDANAGVVGDKTGYALSAAGIQAIWDFATSLMTTVGSIGKRIVDFLTGDSFARLGAPAGASTAADIAAVLAKTPDAAHFTNARGDLLSNLDAAVSSRSTLGGTAQTGDVYALLNGAQAEPAAVPASNASPVVKIGFMFAKMRNKRTVTATTELLRTAGDTATIATAALSDDGTTFTKGEDA